jgi:FAD-dependent urate hydroxylase
MTQSVEVAVVGAGPYGLASTAFLRNAGVDVAAFGEPMGFWRERMPDGMVLRSRRRSSHIADPDGSLSLDAFAASHGADRSDPVPIEEYIRYGCWYQQQVVPDLDTRRVAELLPEGDHFSLRLEDGDRLTARRVILAAGLFPFARRPPSLDQLPPDLVSHSGDHRSFDRFAGRRVLVVGSGQSALESAALLRESGAEVELVGRAAAIVWLTGDAGDDGAGLLQRVSGALPPPTDVGGRVSGWLAAAPDVLSRAPLPLRDWAGRRCIVPAGAAWLRPRLSEVTMTLGRQVSSAQPGSEGLEVRLDDGSRREVDHLMLATGWEVDVARYPFLADPVLKGLRRENGYPILSRGLESSIPGLHFAGAAAFASFGPIVRFVVGTWYAAPVLARAVSGRRQRFVRLSYRPRVGSPAVR